jgi:hypothetical protein
MTELTTTELKMFELYCWAGPGDLPANGGELKLTYDEHLWVVSHCDGFGNMSTETLTELGVEYDWSHVRDSSDKAIDAAHAALIVTRAYKLIDQDPAENLL